MWLVYILKCSDKSLYTGVTTDIERRLLEHNTSDLGSKYTKARRPVKLAYSEKCKNRSEAQKREVQIKKLNKVEKNNLIKNERSFNSSK